MPTKKLRSQGTIVTVVRDTSTRNAATEVFATPIPVQENEITIEKLGYRAVDASALDVAAVSSQKFAVGTFLPAGENIQRVPAPMRDYEYWIDVIDGDIELHKSGIHADEDILNVSADPSGVTMTPTATDPARIYLTGRLRRPTSSRLYVDVTATERSSTVSSFGSTSYAITGAVGEGTVIQYTSSSTRATNPFGLGKRVTIGSGLTPTEYSSRSGVIVAIGGSQGAWTFTIEGATTGASSGSTSAYMYTRITTAAAHLMAVGDTVTVKDSTRSTALTSGFFGIGGVPVITVTVPLGHGIADGERLTLTTTGNIATYLPSGPRTPSVVSATSLSFVGVAPSGTGSISGTMTIALPSGWADGDYVVLEKGTSSIDVEQISTRYVGDRYIGVTNYSDTGSVTAADLPYGSVRVVWWATDELATNHRYIYPENKKVTKLESTAYEATAVQVTLSGGTGGTTNKATLTLSAAHDMQVGELVNVTGTTGVSGTTGPLDGQFTITEITTTSPHTISWDTAATTPTTSRTLVIGGANVGRASLEVYDYAVYVELAANAAPALISQASVFEVVGNENQQIAPNGLLVLRDEAAGSGPSTNFTDDGNTVISVQEYSTEVEAFQDTATIYSDGTISGVLLKGDEVNIDGINVVGDFIEATRNGAAFSSAMALLNRLPRGVVYHGRWSQPATLTLATGTGAQEYVVAHGSFTLDDGRAYRVDLSTGGLVFEQPSRLVFAEVRFSTTAFTSGNYGTSYHLSGYAGGSSTTTDWFVVDGLSGVFHASSAVSAVTDNYRLPSGVPIYWSFILRTGGTISTAITASTRASNSGTAASALVVEDIGPSLLNSSNTLTTSATYVGALTSSGGPGTTTYTATKTVTATESAYFDNYGRGTGSGTYTNQYVLYQGNPGTAGGTKKSAIEFPALGLPSGATITGMRLYLKNRSTYDGSCLVGVAAHGTAELSTTLPTARTTPARTTRTYSSGEAAWITLPSSWYSEFASGASKGILVGITNTSTNTYDSTLSNYGYFDGVGTGMTAPPKLEVTYTYTA